MSNLDLESKIITFNVGGSVFSVEFSSLISRNNSDPDNILIQQETINKDTIFINRDPTYFNYILNYFRYNDKEFKLPKRQELTYLLVEAYYYKLTGLIDIISDYMANRSISKILSNSEIKHIMSYSNIKYKVTELKYRATSNGFDAKDFHLNCDGLSNTLTVIQTTNGRIFGGYTKAKWSSDPDGEKHGYQKDKDAFIFKVGNTRLNFNVEVFNCQANKPAIYNHSDYGPVFGQGHEICIKSNSDKNYLSYSHLGLSFKFSQDNHITYRNIHARSHLTGQNEFKVKEIEIFYFI